MTRVNRPTVSDCAGCRNDFYNGKNDLGVRRCWSLETATFVQVREIHVDQRPPYLDVPIVTRPSCYSKPRFVKVRPEALDAKGFWK